MQTLEPLAQRTGPPLDTTIVLSVDGAPSDLLDLMANPIAERAVLCTHGEVMRPVLDWHELGASAPPGRDRAQSW